MRSLLTILLFLSYVSVLSQVLDGIGDMANDEIEMIAFMAVEDLPLEEIHGDWQDRFLIVQDGFYLHSLKEALRVRDGDKENLKIYREALHGYGIVSYYNGLKSVEMWTELVYKEGIPKRLFYVDEGDKYSIVNEKVLFFYIL